MLSLPTIALMLSYAIPIFFLAMRKISGEHPNYGPFKLGRWGLPINIYAICYCLYCMIWAAFPPILPVDSTTMNYAAPILIGIIFVALADWYTTGHKRFKVPTSKHGIEIIMEPKQNKKDAEDAAS